MGLGVSGLWGGGSVREERLSALCVRESLPLCPCPGWGQPAGMVGYDPEAKCVSTAEAAAAGSASGLVTRVLVSPLDVLKIRFQVPHSRRALGQGWMSLSGSRADRVLGEQVTCAAREH